VHGLRAAAATSPERREVGRAHPPAPAALPAGPGRPLLGLLGLAGRLSFFFN